LDFCPKPKETTNNIEKGLAKFIRSAYLKHCYGPDKPDNEFYVPWTYVPSHWTPKDYQLNQDFVCRISLFANELRALHKRRWASSNLLRIQRNHLKTLRQSPNFAVGNADKNPGPCIIEIARYKDLAFANHLNNRETYAYLKPANAAEHARLLRQKVDKIIPRRRTEFSKSELCCLRIRTGEVKDPYNKLYLTFKVHKPDFKTKPKTRKSGNGKGHTWGCQVPDWEACPEAGISKTSCQQWFMLTQFPMNDASLTPDTGTRAPWNFFPLRIPVVTGSYAT
jgi:hypothetical protein